MVNNKNITWDFTTKQWIIMQNEDKSSSLDVHLKKFNSNFKSYKISKLLKYKHIIANFFKKIDLN